MTLKALYSIFASHKEGRWIMVWENIQSLYDFISKNPIKRILDLGTGIGCSAAVVALALADKGEIEYHIDSIEQFDKCVTIANQLIPEELKSHIIIHKIPAIVWQTPEIPYQYFSNYEYLPGGQWDLLINDGPAPWEENGKYIELFNGTIFQMVLLDKIRPGVFVMYDGRIAALNLLERYFGDNFYLVKPLESKQRFNIIQRKDNAVHCEDSKFFSMKETGYFEGL